MYKVGGEAIMIEESSTTKVGDKLYSALDRGENIINMAIDRIADIIKRNLFCIIEIALIFFPKSPELFTGSYFCKNVWVELQVLVAPALFCCALQSLTQNFGVTFCAAQGI